MFLINKRDFFIPHLSSMTTTSVLHKSTGDIKLREPLCTLIYSLTPIYFFSTLVKINLFLATNISACNKATAKLRTFLETSFYSLLLLFWSLCDQTSYTSCKSWFSAGTFIAKKCAQKSVIFLHLTYSDHFSVKIDLLEKSKIFPRMCVALL